MFKPLKYQQGGKATSQEQLVQLFQAAAENAQVDPQQLVQKASEIGQDEKAAAQFMQGLQLCAQGDPEGIKFIKSLFQSPAFRKGGKIFEFICKHAKGGYVSGCGCKDNGGKMQSGGIVVDDPSYDKVINAPGDTLSTKRYNYSTQTRRTLPNGSIIYSKDTRNGTDNYWDPRYPQPDWWRRTLYSMRPAPIEFYQNWDNIESNHRGEVTKDKTQKDKTGGKVEKAQDGTRSLYQQITADGPETYTDGYGTVRQMNESPIIAGLRKAYHWINMDRTLSDNAYSQKHGYSKPLTGMPPAVYISPVAQEIELAKIIGNRIPKQKPTIRISENLGNGKFSAIDDFGKPVIYDAERDKGLFQIVDKNTFKPEPGFDWDIDKRYGQSLSMIEPTQYDFSKLGRITISWPEFIGKTALKWAPGIVGSAALGSYIATKKDKKKNSGGGGR